MKQIAKLRSPSPDRSSNSRALIVHPKFNGRHPIYQCLGSGKHYQQFQVVSIPGVNKPFVIHQNFQSSDENLGSILWKAGIAGASYITAWLKQQEKSRLTLLELGCGTSALVSQCASLHGAQCVMTDLPNVLEWAKANVKFNSSEQWKGREDFRFTVKQSPKSAIAPGLSARTLRWGELPDIKQLEEDRDVPNHFDVIVAADCLYATSEDSDLQDKLLFTLKRLLARGRTRLFISYVLRTGQEGVFIDTILPSVFPNYIVERIKNQEGVSRCVEMQCVNMLWFRPKNVEED